MTASRRTWIVVGTIAAVIVLAAASVAVLRVMNPPLSPPARAVQSVLELRRDRSTDASAFAYYVGDADIAQTLALDASRTAEATSTAQSPIPRWEPPYVSAQASATAEVVVVWTPDRRFKGWTKATIFNLEKMSGRWKIVDARETTSAPTPELGSKEATKAP